MMVLCVLELVKELKVLMYISQFLFMECILNEKGQNYSSLQTIFVKQALLSK